MFVELECFFPMSNAGLLSYIAGSGFSYFFFFYFFFLLFAHAFCVNLDTAEQSSVMWVRPWLLGPLYPSDGNDISSLTLGASWPRPRPCKHRLCLWMFSVNKARRSRIYGTRLSYYLARHHPPLGVICPYLIVITECKKSFEESGVNRLTLPLPGPAPRGGRSSRGGLSSRRRSSRSPPSPRGPGPPRRSPPRPPRPPPRPLRPSGAPGPVAVSLKLKSMLTTRFWRFTRCGYSTGS